MNRRAGERCPVCQGPAVADPNAPDGLRCRLSSCTHNHQHVACPRCQARDLESVRSVGGKFEYTCRDCTHVWTGPG